MNILFTYFLKNWVVLRLFCRLCIKTCAMMTPLLGFTWLFGLLSSEDKICAYIHTVLSSTQVNTTISIFHQVGVEKCYPSKGKAKKNVFKISTAITAHVYKFCFTGIPDVSFSLCAKHSGNWQFGRQWIYHSHNNY